MTATHRLSQLAASLGNVPFLGGDVPRTIPNLLQLVLQGRALTPAQEAYTLQLLTAAVVELLTEKRPVFPHRVAIGRIVHFVLLTGTRAGHIRPALITHIHSETCINVCVAPDPQDDPISREVETKVEFSPLGEPGTWHWPDQSARDEAFPSTNDLAAPTGPHEARNRERGADGTLSHIVLGGTTTAASAERLHDASPQALAANPPIPNPDTAAS